MRLGFAILLLAACDPVLEVRPLPPFRCERPAETPEELMTRVADELGQMAEMYEGHAPGRENNIWMALMDAKSEVETNIPNVR